MDTIGRYRLVRRLGAGAFATVWLAQDDDLEVPVAVKVLAESWADNADIQQRFLAEARIMRRIRDRHIVGVYDIGALPDGRPYFVMDYVPGGSLEDLRHEQLDPVVVLGVSAEACRALEILHTHQVVHRDVTPGNLLISRRADGGYGVQVADLGIARSVQDDALPTITAGTLSYMAPEQAGRSPLDYRTDVYALAAITYTLLAGRPPFAVRSVTDLRSRDPALSPAPISGLVGAPAELDALLVAGLSLDPARRPPSAGAMAVALDWVADQMVIIRTAADRVVGSIVPSSVQYPPPVDRTRPLGKYLLGVLAVLAAVALAILVGVLVSG